MVPVIPFVVSSSIRITPAKQLWVSKVNDSVKIRMAESGLGSEDPLTVHQMFKYSVEKYHNHIALAYKRDEHLYRISYSIYYEKCRMTAKGFLKLGLDRYHGVGIMAYNCPEWFFANIGAIMAGGLSVGIYMTSSPQTYQHLALNTKANILVVENRKLAEKVLKVKNELPHLKAIVQLKGRKKATDPKIYTWKQLMELSNDIADKQLDDIIDSQYANQCCLIAYTSGSTGAPKGVMISHDNITWNANTSGINMDFGHNNSQERLVSYMPLSHVAVQIMDLWIQMAFGGLTYFANLGKNKNTSKLPWQICGHCLEKKKHHNLYLQNSFHVTKASVPLCYNVANALVFKKVHEEMGLDKCTRNFVGAAPISKRTLDFFHSLCIFIMPIYGLSESTGPHTTSISHQCQPLSCGKVMEGCKIKIYKTDEKLDGEICLWGRNIFMGYLNMPEQTEQTIDAEGWMHTGDLGYLSNDDFLFLTGKIKEFVILGNGMHINPLPIEDAIKNELTIVRHAVLIAIANDLIILLTLKCEVNENTGEPSDVLTRETIAYCRRIGSKATTVSNILFQKDPAIYNAITKGIENVNKKTNSNIPKMNTFIILKRDFSIYGGELGPTLKVRRHVVEQLYKEQMD
ncbi:long-chain-fatty-acid--CoA ligase ACSBG2-like [Callorhinchus milii]|uniref:long-chain-fatty-acid--CoA ligase ACSBG2-like n=1 Tax=Callorhinchus milii TaxID=7868 RepID=UPI0004575700|nr:long-chain-fatty-acid--CoA ligase ACSBG2-like [Callorhinchus milii]|eukprot:gi/632959064/ref/XP_007895402.1/ PREDICTED: long-chain-fatty-acid--CoA ligase ACSBG2-like [Callorhinchus milii]